MYPVLHAVLYTIQGRTLSFDVLFACIFVVWKNKQKSLCFLHSNESGNISKRALASRSVFEAVHLGNSSLFQHAYSSFHSLSCCLWSKEGDTTSPGRRIGSWNLDFGSVWIFGGFDNVENLHQDPIQEYTEWYLDNNCCVFGGWHFDGVAFAFTLLFADDGG